MILGVVDVWLPITVAICTVLVPILCWKNMKWASLPVGFFGGNALLGVACGLGIKLEGAIVFFVFEFLLVCVGLYALVIASRTRIVNIDGISSIEKGAGFRWSDASPANMAFDRRCLRDERLAETYADTAIQIAGYQAQTAFAQAHAAVQIERARADATRWREFNHTLQILANRGQLTAKYLREIVDWLATYRDQNPEWQNFAGSLYPQLEQAARQNDTNTAIQLYNQYSPEIQAEHDRRRRVIEAQRGNYRN